MSETAPPRILTPSVIADLKAYMSAGDLAVKQDLKVWIMGALLLWTAPAFGTVFYLGQISNKLDAAFQTQAQQQAVITERGAWMDRRERTEESLIAWAKTKGYVAPEPVR